MQIVSKLQTVGMLIALVFAIGGGFYTWGTFNQRLDVIEQKEFVVNETADFTVVYEKIDDLKKDIFIENKDLKEKREAWHKNLSKDLYISEALNVLSQLKLANNQEIVKN